MHDDAPGLVIRFSARSGLFRREISLSKLAPGSTDDVHDVGRVDQAFIGERRD